MATTSMAAEDKKWKIESDARVIKEFGAIASDAKRYSAAKKYLAEEAKNAQKVIDGSMWDKIRNKK